MRQYNQKKIPRTPKASPKAGPTTRHVTAPVASGTRRFGSAPKLTTNSDSIRVNHAELFGQVTAVDPMELGASAYHFTAKYTIQPAYTEVFPWLSAIADRYEKYKFTALAFEYTPMCPTSTPGLIVLSLDYDPDDAHTGFIDDLEARISMMSRPDCAQGPIWTSLRLEVPKARLRDVGERFVKNWTGESTSTEPRTSHMGILSVLATALPAATLCGDITVHYEVTLLHPQIPDSSQSKVSSAALFPLTESEGGAAIVETSVPIEPLQMDTMAGAEITDFVSESTDDSIISFVPLPAEAALGPDYLAFAIEPTENFVGDVLIERDLLNVTINDTTSRDELLHVNVPSDPLNKWALKTWNTDKKAWYLNSPTLEGYLFEHWIEPMVSDLGETLGLSYVTSPLLKEVFRVAGSFLKGALYAPYIPTGSIPSGFTKYGSKVKATATPFQGNGGWHTELKRRVVRARGPKSSGLTTIFPVRPRNPEVRYKNPGHLPSESAPGADQAPKTVISTKESSEQNKRADGPVRASTSSQNKK